MENTKEKDTEKEKLQKFLEQMLDFCVLMTMSDWSKKDPKKEFTTLGEYIIKFQLLQGWKE